MSGHGGKRRGAGRPKGAKSRMTEKAILEAGKGVMPLEFMLNVMRDDSQDFAVRFDAAKAAAPYVHARLSSVDQTVTVKQDASEFSAAELEAIIAEGSSSGASTPQDGDGSSGTVH